MRVVHAMKPESILDMVTGHNPDHHMGPVQHHQAPPSGSNATAKASRLQVETENPFVREQQLFAHVLTFDSLVWHEVERNATIRTGHQRTDVRIWLGTLRATHEL